jgi:hypothetical protein
MSKSESEDIWRINEFSAYACRKCLAWVGPYEKCSQTCGFCVSRPEDASLVDWKDPLNSRVSESGRNLYYCKCSPPWKKMYLDRLLQIEGYPRMWGGLEGIEASYRTTLEFLSEQLGFPARHVADSYIRVLSNKGYPKNLPIFKSEEELDKVVQFLRCVRVEVLCGS